MTLFIRLWQELNKREKRKHNTNHCRTFQVFYYLKPQNFHTRTAKMLESKKPSHLIKKLHSNEVEIKVNFLDETVHTFSVKVSARFVYTSVKKK